MVVGIGVIAGTECVIIANDPSVLGGALTPYAGKKWMRALEIARDNRMPYVSFVESAGADLRVEADGGSGRRVQTFHFAESGRFFYDLIDLSKLRIPTVCVVFGSSTAGGAYQPGLSDYNIVVKEQSKIFLAGPPLVKMATGEESDAETLGGA
jgi:acyl-CoA carboxylase subunit beta